MPTDPAKKQYPEAIPSGIAPIEEQSFKFDIKASEDTKKELKSEIEALEERLSRLTRRKELEIKGIPILPQLIGITQDEQELRRLGKALIRVSELVPRLEYLNKKLTVIETAETDPRWIMATFGDFSSEVEDQEQIDKWGIS